MAAAAAAAEDRKSLKAQQKEAAKMDPHAFEGRWIDVEGEGLGLGFVKAFAKHHATSPLADSRRFSFGESPRSTISSCASGSSDMGCWWQKSDGPENDERRRRCGDEPLLSGRGVLP